MKLIKSFHFLPTIFFIVGQDGPPNTAGPRSIAVSATMVVTPLGEDETQTYYFLFAVKRDIGGVSISRLAANRK